MPMKCLLHLMLALAFCARAGAADALRVSSFSTILTEIAAEVGGGRVSVHAHLKPGVDPHDFQPKPDDLRAVATAQIVLLSAKHLEAYVGKLKGATGSRATFVEVGDAMPSLKLTSEHGDHSHDGEDPHWWHSIANMRRATKIVRDAFIAASFTQFSPTAMLAFMVVGPRVDLKLVGMQAGIFGRRFAARFAPTTFVVAVLMSTLIGWWLLT